MNTPRGWERCGEGGAKTGFSPRTAEKMARRAMERRICRSEAANYVFAAMLLGEAPKQVANTDELTNGPTNVKGKAAVVQYLKDSFAAAHKAVATVNEKNELEMVKFPFGDSKMTRLYAANIFAWHSMDHYGQLVVYARMNGVVPPASRQN